MLINEIEVKGPTFSARRLKTAVEQSIAELFETLMQKCDAFNLEVELPGIHDCDHDETTLRGFYSMVIPFEVEHLVDGISTKTLLKRIESCEFIISAQICVLFGNAGCGKCFASALAAATGVHVDFAEYEFNHLSQIQERMTRIKTIVVTNPKEKEVRRARLAGHMEHYTEYNVIDPRNHGIDSIQGMIDTPLGPMMLKLSKNGSFALGVKKGMILTVECLEWIFQLIESEDKPAIYGKGAAF